MLAVALKSIRVVTMHRVAETVNSVITMMTYGTDFKLVNILCSANLNLTYKDLNISIDKPETTGNINLVSYDTLTSRAKPLSNNQLSYCKKEYSDF